MSKTHLLAIDAGTQSVRALLFDLQGNLADKAQVPIDTYRSPQPGWMENDAQAFWDTLCRACRQLLATTKVPARDIAGVVNIPEVSARMNAMGCIPRTNTPEAFAAFVRSEMQKWGTLAKKVNLTPT